MAQIRVLGSAAAEGVPAIFCDCPICREAWKRGGHDRRMRTAYSLNERVRIDLGPDTLAQEQRFDLHGEELRHLFLTHSHEDHFDPSLLFYRLNGFSKVREGSTLKVYGNPGVLRKMEQYMRENLSDIFTGDYSILNVQPVLVESYKPIELPDEDMTFYPMPADHMQDSDIEKPNIYVFRVGTSWGMIANDTGYPREEVWQYLKKQAFRLELVIADCCFALKDCDRGHMGRQANVQMKERLTAMGCLDDHSQYVVNHFSHNGLALHQTLEECYAPYGIQVGYDGMVIDF